MNLPTQPYKGARDFYPDDKRQQNYIFNVLKSTVRSYGYEEYDAPMLESIDLYLAKSGKEIISDQTYNFVDRGGRAVAIRPEMTPSVSRMVAARRQQLAYPLRWFSLPNLWRYERPQRGRYREHWQLNVDLFGAGGINADLEIIVLASALLKAFKANDSMFKIKINHRKLLNIALLDYLKLEKKQSDLIIKLIDRRSKIEASEFMDQLDLILDTSQKQDLVSEKLLELLDINDINNLPDFLKSQNETTELNELFNKLHDEGVTNFEFDISTVRGFDYYTSIVFEVLDNDPENNRSMMGGGRYDGLVGLFGVDPVDTIGFGLGDATLSNFLIGHNLMPPIKNDIDIYLAVIGNQHAASRSIAASLRKAGLNVAVNLDDKRIGDQIKTADKKGINYVLILGEKEFASKKFTLRNLRTSEEQVLSIENIIKLIK